MPHRFNCQPWIKCKVQKFVVSSELITHSILEEDSPSIAYAAEDLVEGLLGIEHQLEHLVHDRPSGSQAEEGVPQLPDRVSLVGPEVAVPEVYHAPGEQVVKVVEEFLPAALAFLRREVHGPVGE